MNVLFAASEARPFIASGGLADVIGLTGIGGGVWSASGIWELKSYRINSFIEDGEFTENLSRDELIKRAAGGLSKELLYMKFLQGVPVVGAVGGVYDAVYMQRITKYAELKYRRRFYMNF